MRDKKVLILGVGILIVVALAVATAAVIYFNQRNSPANPAGVAGNFRGNRANFSTATGSVIGISGKNLTVESSTGQTIVITAASTRYSAIETSTKAEVIAVDKTVMLTGKTNGDSELAAETVQSIENPQQQAQTDLPDSFPRGGDFQRQFQGPAGDTNNLPQVGKIKSVSESGFVIEVRNRDITVTVTDSTKYTKSIAAEFAGIKEGSEVQVSGRKDDKTGSITAVNITITKK